MGFASEMITSPVQVPIPFDGHIETMSGGGGHVLIYTDRNRLYSCGWNNKGQLGLGDLLDRNTFEKIRLELHPDERVLQLSCGWDTSAVLTTNHRLFVFGGNNFLQLGMKDPKEKIMAPLELKLPNDEVPLQVELSMRQIAIRTKSSSIWVSGKSKAVEELLSVLPNPHAPFRVLTPDEPIEHITAGQHHINYAQGNRVTGIGQNKFGQSEDQLFPEKVVHLRTGWTHNACLLSSGDAYLWGRNCYGQLGMGKVSESEKIPVKFPAMLQQIHLGSEHGIAVDKLGDIYTWGWNEHGNCGNGSEENILVPERIEIQGGGKAINSCCGEGFCFVVTAAKCEGIK